MGGASIPGVRGTPLSRRRGLSLIELLTVVMIVGLLLALLLPAVMRARAAARRARCASNLHNLGLALNQHLSVREAFPSGAGERSFLWALLPYLEQANLRNWRIDDDTAVAPIPGVFLCPSDEPRGAALARYATSYAGNAGTFGREPPSEWDGAFAADRLKPADVTDGLSRTAAVSEWIVGDGDDGRPSRLGSIAILDVDFPDSAVGLGSFARTCEAAIPGRTCAVGSPYKGSYWFRGRLGHSLYTHALVPGRPSCRAAPDLNAITAGSLHGGGAHVLTLDGGARFVRDSIAPAVWRALGTRSGGEAVSDADY